MLNVLILADSLKLLGGIECATVAIANQLARTPGVHVRACTNEYDRELLDPSIDVTHLPVPKPKRLIWRFHYAYLVRELKHVLSRHDFSHVDLCYTRKMPNGIAFKKLYPDIPMIVHTGYVLAARHYLEEKGVQHSNRARVNAGLLDRMERRLYRQPGCCHVVSTAFVAEQREKHFRLPRGFFEICPLGVDTSRFEANGASADVKRELGIPETATVLVSVARLRRGKNVDMVLKALQSPPLRDVHYVIVGDGPQLEPLKRLADECQVRPRTHFVGFEQNPGRYYAASDVLVLPSSLESFGQVYAEAMYLGLPCIGLRKSPPEVMSAAEDVIPEGQAGYCVSNQEELVDRLATLVGDRELRARMGAFAADYARRYYSFPHYVESMFRLARERFGVENVT